MIFIGPLPPPIMGMSAMNQAVLEQLSAVGIEVKMINISPKSLRRNILSRLTKLPAVFIGLLQLRKMLKKKKTPVYISIASRWGQVYDLCMVIIARIYGVGIIFHHHTFVFLLKKKYLPSILFLIAGKKARHIVLCKTMSQCLKKHYQTVNVTVVSNITLMPLLNGTTRKKLNTIGFISNITAEKGAYLMIELAKAIASKQLPVKIIMAGPCPESTLSLTLKRADREGVLKWIGPVYNKDKTIFFSSIDALIMPTQNEAEPLVIWEALGTGSPVISYGRGCISEQIKENAGVIIKIRDDFVANALKTIEQWLSDPLQYSNCSASALKVYQDAITNCEQGKARLLNVVNYE